MKVSMIAVALACGLSFASAAALAVREPTEATGQQLGDRQTPPPCCAYFTYYVNGKVTKQLRCGACGVVDGGDPGQGSGSGDYDGGGGGGGGGGEGIDDNPPHEED